MKSAKLASLDALQLSSEISGSITLDYALLKKIFLKSSYEAKPKKASICGLPK